MSFKHIFYTLVTISSVALVVSLNGADKEESAVHKPIIHDIKILGNNLVQKRAIAAKIVYKKGQKFDENLSGQMIKNIYGMGYFSDVQLHKEELSSHKIDLLISVIEKKKLGAVVYEGNDNLDKDEIEKKLKFADVPTISDVELPVYIERLKKLYAEKNYHAVTIVSELVPTTKDHVDLHIKITEGQSTIVKCILFEGNQHVSGKKLRSLIFTKEDWLLGALDHSGSFQQEMLEGDKYALENYYQSNGYLAAKVTDIKVDRQEDQTLTITYFVEEGPYFTVKSLHIPGNELLSEQQLCSIVPIQAGQMYSRDLIRKSMERLRLAWGQFGHIYADISPEIVPNMEEKTVDISFNSELGDKVFLNRIAITGNKKTRDYVIRRNMIVDEGQLLTTQQMEVSKARVTALGFFEQRDGVNWKTHRINQETADLELIVKEIKTGSINGQIGFGGSDIDMRSPSRAFKVGLTVSDRNARGTGVMYNAAVNYSKDDWSASLGIRQPWVFNRPLSVGGDLWHRHVVYEDFGSSVRDVPIERTTGCGSNIGFVSRRWYDMNVITSLNFEDIRYNQVVARAEGAMYQTALQRKFQSGDLLSVGFSLGQNLLNNPAFPSNGYNWNLSSKIGLPASSKFFGFSRLDLDTAWFTPLIGDNDLIFYLHGHFSLISQFKHYALPYRELNNVGGPATVRGFEFGQIGPQVQGSPFGAKKAFWVNAELIFPIAQDQSIRGIFFYDGGAGWDTPNFEQLIEEGLVVTNNNLHYRHAVGFGVRLTSPVPLKIDWGFKLDRNKRRNESAFEVHFSMTQDF